MQKSIPIIVLLGVTLAACSNGDGGDVGGNGLTEGEAQQLERAAERIDNRPDSVAKAQSEALESDIRARLDTERRAVETQ
jgi:hypothetical protein